MNNILDTILEAKKKEIEQLKPLKSIAGFENEIFSKERENRSLVGQLSAPGSWGIIAEFKRKSPSKGWFKAPDLEVEEVARDYDRFGASGISVLTDENFFGGRLQDLEQAKAVCRIPLLRKDFIIDPWQVAQSKAAGADLVLFIAACLKPAEVKSLASYAGSIGLESILEIHQEDELDHICDEVNLVGVNNRDLKTFGVDIRTSLRLIRYLPAEKPAISESGISDAEAIITLRDAGFRGFLVGENFMKEENPGMAFGKFIAGLKPLP